MSKLSITLLAWAGIGLAFAVIFEIIELMPAKKDAKHLPKQDHPVLRSKMKNLGEWAGSALLFAGFNVILGPILPALWGLFHLLFRRLLKQQAALR